MICPSCKAENDATAESCFTCGKGLTSLTQGSLVGSRYEILRFIGKGGMGMIYKAHDRVLDEVVALKTLRPHVAGDADMVRRFIAEIKMARKVRHRNVCAIHDYGEDHGLVYISMEYIDGIDLKQIIQEQGTLSLDDAYEVAIQSAKGLEAIHDAGVVHRDLKTHNLMRDARGIVKLLDFGIAKEKDSDKGLTGTGQLVGTPEYMSPEQVRGQVVDHRSDLYALGIVIFECFTGQVPFKGETPIITLFKHLEEPPPLSGPAAQGIPKPLLPVLAKALAKSPDDRYATAAALIDAIREARNATFPEYTPTPMPFRAPLGPRGLRIPDPEQVTPVAVRAPALTPPPAAPPPGQARPPVLTPEPRTPPPPPAPAMPAPAAPPAPAHPAEAREVPAPRPAPPDRPEPWPRPEPVRDVPAAPPEPPAPPPLEAKARPTAATTPAARVETPPPRTERPVAREPPPQQPRSPTRALRMPVRPVPAPSAPLPRTESASIPAPPRPSWRLAWVIAGGAAAVLAVGVAAWSLWSLALRPPKGEPSASTRTRPAEEVVTVVPPQNLDPGPAPVEEVVTIVPGATPPPTPAPISEAAAGSAISPAAVQAGTSVPSESPRLALRTEPGPAPTSAPPPTRVAADLGRAGSATAPVPTAGQVPSVPPTRPPPLTAPPRAAPSGRFETGRTRLVSDREAKGPKGFDMTGLDAAMQATEFLGRIEFVGDPPQPSAGDRFTMRIYLVNSGEKDVKIRNVTITTLVGGQRSPSAVPPLVREVAAGERSLVYAVSNVWSGGGWALQAEILTSRNEKVRNSVRWLTGS